MAKLLFAPASSPVSTSLAGPSEAPSPRTVHTDASTSEGLPLEGRKREHTTRYEPPGEKDTPWTVSAAECPAAENSSWPLPVSTTEMTGPPVCARLASSSPRPSVAYGALKSIVEVDRRPRPPVPQWRVGSTRVGPVGPREAGRSRQWGHSAVGEWAARRCSLRYIETLYSAYSSA